MLKFSHLEQKGWTLKPQTSPQTSCCGWLSTFDPLDCHRHLSLTVGSCVVIKSTRSQLWFITVSGRTKPGQVSMLQQAVSFQPRSHLTRYEQVGLPDKV